MAIELICLDADDTLWHHGDQYERANRRFADLLQPFAEKVTIQAHLSVIEAKNLSAYGYGAKSFALSIIETALEIGGSRIKAETLASVLQIGRDMISHQVNLIDGVEAALGNLSQYGRLVLITKGDLFLQETKLAASGLATMFSGVEIVSDKTAATYRRIFDDYGVSPERALMAGNSVRSDVVPVLECGGYAALIPYPVEWAHETARIPLSNPRFRKLGSLTDLALWISSLQSM